jgi:hypothetical protein
MCSSVSYITPGVLQSIFFFIDSVFSADMSDSVFTF